MHCTRYQPVQSLRKAESRIFEVDESFGRESIDGGEIEQEINQMSARSAQPKGEVSALQSGLTELTVTQTQTELNAKQHFKMLNTPGKAS